MPSLGAHYISSLGDGDFKFDNETVDSWLTYNASVGYDITANQAVLLSVRRPDGQRTALRILTY